MGGVDMTERYLKYQKRYRAYIINHTLRASFDTLICLFVIVVCVAWFINMRYSVLSSEKKLILSTIIILFLSIFVIIGISSVKDYWKEIAQLRAGEVTVKTGTIIEKSSKNIYLVEFSVSDGKKKRKLSHSKRKKAVKNDIIEKHHTVLRYFYISPKNREHNFDIGEKITMVHATTRILKMNGFTNWRVQTCSFKTPPYFIYDYVIYAFEGDETKTIPKIKWEI